MLVLLVDEVLVLLVEDELVAVRRDLAARGQRWVELDGRFRGWVVVRGGTGTGGAGGGGARVARPAAGRRGRARAA